MGSFSAIRFVRAAVGVVLALVFLGVGFAGWSHFRNEAAWRRASRAGAVELAVFAGDSASPHFALEQGRMVLDDAFPPRPGEAAEIFRRGLESSPRMSTLWTRLAEAELFSGRPDRAIVALERAAALDPMNPRRRRRAIRLWELAGQPDRAREAARELAALGPSRLAQAVEELALLGDSPGGVFAALGLASLSAEDRPVLADSMDRTFGPGGFASVLEDVPAAWLEDRALRHRALRSALAPLREETARRLWIRDLEAAGLPFEVTGGLVRPLAPSDRAPWGEAGPLGWQAPPSGTGVRIAWSAEPEPRAVIELDRNLGRRFQWNLLRAVVPAERAIRVTGEVRVSPPGNSDVILSVESDGFAEPLRRYGSREEAGWQDISVDVPAFPNGAVLRIILLRDQRGFLDPGVQPRLEWRAVRLDLLEEGMRE